MNELKKFTALSRRDMQTINGGVVDRGDCKDFSSGFRQPEPGRYCSYGGE